MIRTQAKQLNRLTATVIRSLAVYSKQGRAEEVSELLAAYLDYLQKQEKHN